MYDMQIPTELKKTILKRMLVRVSFFMLLFILNLVVVVNWWDALFPIDKINVIAKYSFAIIFLALPFFLTKIYKIFTDTSYMGTVRDVKVLSVVDSKSSVKPSWEMLYRKNEIHLTVETPNGKLIKKKVYEGLPKHAANLERYQVGDQILHLHGTGITIVLPSPNDTHCSCAVCGGRSDVANSVCIHCGKPLIK